MLFWGLFMGVCRTEENTVLCEMLGSPEVPLLTKKGDITIGGAFSIHSQISKPSFSLTHTPETLTCSRFVFFPFAGFMT